jgi:hypothetical protein
VARPDDGGVDPPWRPVGANFGGPPPVVSVESGIRIGAGEQRTRELTVTEAAVGRYALVHVGPGAIPVPSEYRLEVTIAEE